MKNKQLNSLLIGIESCGNITKQPFRSKCMYNARAIRAELEQLTASIARPTGWESYEKEQKILIDTYATSIENNVPVFGENADVVNKEFTALKKKYAKLLDDMRKINEDFEKNVLDADVSDTLKLRYIAETELPRELTLQQCIGIDAIISYSES